MFQKVLQTVAAGFSVAASPAFAAFTGPGGEALKKDGLKWTVAGMATLLSGQKLPALGMFGRGAVMLERHWREAHPEFAGGMRERIEQALAHYEATHRHPTNRMLHVVGIPMIVGGAVGLLAAPVYRPLWWASAGFFTLGWQLNIAGHVFFEKSRPAFADDPLSFVVGPLWDFRQIADKVRERISRGRGSAGDGARRAPAA